MAIAALRQQPPARRAHQQAELHEVGLDHVLDDVALLGERRGQRLDADRAAAAAAGLDPAQAAARWREVLEQDPDNLAARAGLADLALEEGATARLSERPRRAPATDPRPVSGS